MAKFEGGIIHPTARYRTQSDSQARGVYNLKEQYRHVANSNWPTLFPGWPSNNGQRITVSINETSSTADDTGAYVVHHEDMDAAAAVGSTGRLYLAIKNTASGSQAYYNDFAIGAVQFRSSGDVVLNHGWSFSVAADYTDWEYATVTGLNTVNAGYENYYDIINATSQSWAACVNGVSNARISRASGTGSTYTGPADGVAVTYSDGDASPTTFASATVSVAQTGSTSFMYTESSGTSANITGKWYWVRSPEVTLDGNSNKILTIVYNATTRTGVGTRMVDAADNQLFRWWWIPS